MATIHAHLRVDCGAMRCDLGFSNCKSLNSGLCSVKMPHSGTFLRIFLTRCSRGAPQANLRLALRFRASAPHCAPSCMVLACRFPHAYVFALYSLIDGTLERGTHEIRRAQRRNQGRDEGARQCASRYSAPGARRDQEYRGQRAPRGDRCRRRRHAQARHQADGRNARGLY